MLNEQPPISQTVQLRKIIHVDMDCFYAAIEIRDNPSLVNQPVAVGGSPDERGVICTCNYIARRYGIHSAMASARAHRLCKKLILLPVNMPKYRLTSRHIHEIFHEFTDQVEPLSLDEAYLDVTHVAHYHGSATLIAKAIRRRIWEAERLTASAGVAPNKLLAKIASAWKKPDGLLVIQPHEVDVFMKHLPVDKLLGVGKVTAGKLHRLGLKTCADLQALSLSALIERWGSKLGQHLYEQCRGEDHRQVVPHRMRQSLSVETTLMRDIQDFSTCTDVVKELYNRLIRRIQRSSSHRRIKNQYIKIKFSDFKLTTACTARNEINLECFFLLFRKSFMKENKAIRLLGLGVHFDDDASGSFWQQSLF